MCWEKFYNIQEVCFCDINSVIEVMKRFDEWEEGGRKDRRLLVEIVYIMCNSEMFKFKLKDSLISLIWPTVRLGFIIFFFNDCNI